jgi:murein DD-endopeptidase MepM/ murein hydrolase activator NlpD
LIKTITLTAALTTLFWFVVAAWWYQHTVPPADRRPMQEMDPIVLATGTVQAAEVSGLIIPVVGVRPEQLVDTFSQARASGARHHDAIDIMAPRGAPVVAAAPGRVEKLFLSKDGGNTVYVRSADGRRMYYYAHLDSYSPGLREGLMLRRGAAIGAAGSTGNANPSAPHLHFAIWITSPEKKWWEDATALNPYPLLKQAQ